jgi:hypothetical protein
MDAVMNYNTFHLRAFVGLGAIVALLMTQPDVSVAQNSRTFAACYVPDVGAVYLVGEPGLPDACLSANHEKIQWSESGGGVVTILDGSVTTDKLADEAVTGAKIADATIQADDIVDGTITAAKLEPGVIAGVQPGSIGTTELADAAVTSTKLASGAVGAVNMAARAVRNLTIQDNAVDSRTIVDNSISGLDIAADAVQTRHIRDGQVDGKKITDNSITADDIAAKAVGSDELAIPIAWRVDGSTLAANATTLFTVACTASAPSIVSGGWSTNPPVTVLRSYPNLGVTPNQWEVLLKNGTPLQVSVDLYALCADW